MDFSALLAARWQMITITLTLDNPNVRQRGQPCLAPALPPRQAAVCAWRAVARPVMNATHS